MFSAVQRQMIFWTSLLVAGLGFAVAIIMLQPPTAEKSLVMSRAYARKLKRVESLQASSLAITQATALNPKRLSAPDAKSAAEKRAPASKPAPPPEMSAMALDDKNSFQAVDLTLQCKDAGKTSFAKGVAQVRLNGRACEPGAEIASTEVRNDSNGFSATVFFPKPGKFLTDYITLAQGENKIRVLHVLKNGAREEHAYVIDRAPAATIDD